MNRKLFSILSVAAVLLCGGLIMVLLSSNKAEPSLAEETSEARSVRTGTLIPAEETVWIGADGFLKARRQLDLSVPVAGKAVYVKEGLKGGVPVEEGDLLLSLDDRRARLAFLGARADMIQATNQFLAVAGLDGGERLLWETYLGRLERSGAENLPSLPETGGRIEQLAVTKGVYGGSYALERAAMDLTDHFLKAPFTGVLTGDGVSEGAWVSPGVALSGLVESGALELTLSLTAEDILHVEPGDGVVITRPEDDSRLFGLIERIEPLLSAGSQTAQIHISLDVPSEERWLPGAFVSARIRGKRFDSACRIPREVLSGDRIPLYEEGKLVFRKVSLWAYDGSDVIIAPDFPPGTEYVATVLQNPMEGMLLEREGDS